MACLANSARLVVIDTVWGHTGEALSSDLERPWALIGSDWLNNFYQPVADRIHMTIPLFKQKLTSS